MDYTRGTRFYLSSVCFLLCVCLSFTQSSSPSPAAFVFASVRRVCRRHLLFGLASRLQMGLKLIVLEIGRFACACQFL